MTVPAAERATWTGGCCWSRFLVAASAGLVRAATAKNAAIAAAKPIDTRMIRSGSPASTRNVACFDGRRQHFRQRSGRGPVPSRARKGARLQRDREDLAQRQPAAELQGAECCVARQRRLNGVFRGRGEDRAALAAEGAFHFGIGEQHGKGGGAGGGEQSE